MLLHHFIVVLIILPQNTNPNVVFGWEEMNGMSTNNGQNRVRTEDLKKI